MEQLNLSELIKEISPLYNSYKQSSRTISGTEALCIMWDIGDILHKKIHEFNLVPHNLYRKIYGKSEGATDIVQKSYITREFLGRSYRIRNMFQNKGEIKKILPNLHSFIPFREAMPFFDNKKYKLIGKDRDDLLSLLNSSDRSHNILDKVKVLQNQRIGKKNPRTQKLAELEEEKMIFISFYNYLFNLIKSSDYARIKTALSHIDLPTITILTSMTSCLAQEGLKFPVAPDGNFDDQWAPYVKMLSSFSIQKTPLERRRFRRLIEPTRIIKLAEMLQSISSEDSFKSFKRIE